MRSTALIPPEDRLGRGVFSSSGSAITLYTTDEEEFSASILAVKRHDDADADDDDGECIGIPLDNLDHLEQERLFISSPNYPLPYPNNVDLCWKVKTRQI